MILSPRHKFLFIHLPHASGCAVSNALLHASDDGNLISASLRPHATAEEMKGVMRPRDWDRFLKFAVVRNPWDRMVSEFWFNGGLGRQFDNFTRAEMAFTDWVYQEVSDRGEYGPSLVDDTVMIDGQYAMDASIRYEYLEADLSEVAEAIGISVSVNAPTPSLERRRQFPNHYTEYYNEDTRVLVRRHHHQFLKAVPYKFRKFKA